MRVTATELKSNVGHYLSMAEKEDIIITRNGKKIARIVHEEEDLVEIAKSLFGILPSDVTKEEIKEERAKRYESTT